MWTRVCAEEKGLATQVHMDANRNQIKTVTMIVQAELDCIQDMSQSVTTGASAKEQRTKTSNA